MSSSTATTNLATALHFPAHMATPPDSPARLPSTMTLATAIACIALVAVDLRPGIVSVGPLLAQIRVEFGISNTQASLLTAIPNVFMGLLAIPTPWLARRFGRDRVILAALAGLAWPRWRGPSWAAWPGNFGAALWALVAMGVVKLSLAPFLAPARQRG